MKHYIVLNYQEVLDSFDTIREAVYCFEAKKAAGGEPTIVKLVTWQTEITDVTSLDKPKSTEKTNEHK